MTDNKSCCRLVTAMRLLVPFIPSLSSSIYHRLFLVLAADCDDMLELQDKADSFSQGWSSPQQSQVPPPQAQMSKLQAFIDEQMELKRYEESQASDDEDTEKLQLMTLHKSKGLEFKVVFVIGCEDGLLPNTAWKGPTDVQEEKRLLYVGITRTIQRVYLTTCKVCGMWQSAFADCPACHRAAAWWFVPKQVRPLPSDTGGTGPSSGVGRPKRGEGRRLMCLGSPHMD